MHWAPRPAQPGNRRTRVFSICKEAYVGKPRRTPRETVYSPGMCSSPTSPDGVAHKPHFLSIKPSPDFHERRRKRRVLEHPDHSEEGSFSSTTFVNDPG